MGLTGKTKSVSGVPSDVRDLRQQTIGYLTGSPGQMPSGGGMWSNLMNQLPSQRYAMMQPNSPSQGGGIGRFMNNDPVNIADADNQFFLQNIMGPYQQMFAAQRGAATAQAKEQAGNLTGSGYNNILGSSLAQSLGNEQGMLAQTMMGLHGQQQQFNLASAQLEQQRRQQNAANFMQILNSLQNTGVGPDQQVYQPGFLDYAMKGAAMAAPFFMGPAGIAVGAANMAGQMGGGGGGMAPTPPFNPNGGGYNLPGFPVY